MARRPLLRSFAPFKPKKAKAAISSLPYEILCHIFKLAVADLDHNTINTKANYRTLVDFSLVNKHWNAVVNSSPTLWSKIQITGDSNALQEVLERSRAVPLIIDCPASDNVDPAETLLSLNVLLPNLQRIQYLEYDAIRVDDEYFRDVINPQFCSEAPMLRRLLLTVSPPEPLHALASQLDDEMIPRLPANIFGGTQAPLLDFLFLSGIKLPSWSSHILHNLTALFLDTQDRPTFAELSSALRNMPGLHTLVLSNCLPLDTPLGVGLTHPQKARLPNLSRVDLCESEHVSAFLPFLKAVQIAPLEMEVSTTLGCPNELPSDAWVALLDACIEALTPRILNLGGALMYAEGCDVYLSQRSPVHSQIHILHFGVACQEGHKWSNCRVQLDLIHLALRQPYL